jgi:uncharacterized membrane protein
MNKLFDWLFNPNVLATVKMITYKILSGSTTFILVYIWTGSAKSSGQATVVLMIIHMAQYWVHERLWLIWENRRRDADQGDNNG